MEKFVTFDLRRIEYGTKAYREMVELRHRVLRAPLGMNFTPEFLAQDKSDFLLGAYENDKLIACLILTYREDKTVQMRQVAVDFSHHRRGVGRQLVKLAEQEIKRQSPPVPQIFLNARESAVPFYKSLGYKEEGEPFEEVTLMHFRMIKNLESEIHPHGTN